jgi:thioredoxin-dependent peroxiredoxin
MKSGIFCPTSKKSSLGKENSEMRKHGFGLAVVLFCVVAATSATALNDAPTVGDPAPDFKLTSNEGKLAGLGDFKGKWLVLYFYPKDFTSGCTLEAHNFQQDLEKYNKLNAVIVGVSIDTADSHKSFCEKEGLNFKLLSDTDAKVSAQYGSVMEYNGMKLSARNTFIIDPESKVARVFMKVNPKVHSEEVLAALEQLQKKPEM